MKRRLCAALALIGDPPIIDVDETTSGVYPVSRRQFWDTITTLKQSGSSGIVLPTHSMEECEFHCSRLGIMVNGELQCLGRVQHLKDKFAKGYSLTLRLWSAADQRTDASHQPGRPVTAERRDTEQSTTIAIEYSHPEMHPEHELREPQGSKMSVPGTRKGLHKPTPSR